MLTGAYLTVFHALYNGSVKACKKIIRKENVNAQKSAHKCGKMALIGDDFFSVAPFLLDVCLFTTPSLMTENFADDHVPPLPGS